MAQRLPLMDDVNALTHRDGLERGTRRFDDATRRVLRVYREKLRAAERYVLDDDAVRTICHLSHERDLMAAHAVLARLPFEAVWFEMNLHVRVLEFEKMGTLQGKRAELNAISPVVGYLFYRDGVGGARWICHPFYRAHGAKHDELGARFEEMMTGRDAARPEIVVPGLLAFVFDPEGSARDPVAGSPTWKAPSLSSLPGFPRVPSVVTANSKSLVVGRPTVRSELVLAGEMGSGVKLTELAELARNPNLSDANLENAFFASNWFTHRGAVIKDPFWDRYAPRLPNQMYLDEVMEQAGVVRWLVTLLATVNAVPREVKEVETRGRKRVVGGKVLPHLQHRTISLKIPRGNRTEWARSRVEASARRPWHRVSGHWRTAERGRAVGCRHLPTMVEDGVAICSKCELMIRWIADHHRGDRAVGTVEHTYRVRT